MQAHGTWPAFPFAKGFYARYSFATRVFPFSEPAAASLKIKPSTYQPPIAQLVERRAYTSVVLGSSPSGWTLSL